MVCLIRHTISEVLGPQAKNSQSGLNCSVHESNIQNGNYFKGKNNLELEKLLFLFFNPCIVLFITTSETAKLKVIHYWVQ